jgi:hypothetical protein
MGLQLAPGYIGQGSFATPVELDRNVAAAIAGRRTGAFRYNDFALAPSVSGMQMSIGLGNAIIMGGETSSTQGAYHVWSSATDILSWPAAAGSPRYDTLLLRVIDLQYGTDASPNGAYWQVVSGVASGSPVPLADSVFATGGAQHRPGAWWRVADVLVPASVTNLSTATVVNKRRYCRIGRSVLCNYADLPTDQMIGDEATILDDHNNKVIWDGTAWVGIGQGGVWNSLLAYIASGYNPNSSFGFAPAYKLQGNTVKLRGNLAKASGGIPTSTNFITLPAQLRPVSNTYFSVPSYQGTSTYSTTRLDIAPTGTISISYSTGTTGAYAPQWVSLDGIEYDLF